VAPFFLSYADAATRARFGRHAFMSHDKSDLPERGAPFIFFPTRFPRTPKGKAS
jgi:hypothetical protein